MGHLKLSSNLKNLIDLQDLFVFGGLAMTGYGLYIYRPWVAYVVSGSCLMIIGLFYGAKVQK